MEKLTAVQFARLTELLVKGNAVTADESAEKAALEAVIVAEDAAPQVISAPEDDDDTDPPADEAEGEVVEPDGETAIVDDIDPAAFEKLGMKAKFSLLFSSRAGLLAKLNESRAAEVAHTAQITELTARASAAEAAYTTAQAALTEAVARVGTLEAEQKDLNAAVTDELAGLGVARQDLVAGIADGSGDDEVPATESALESALAGLSSHSEKAALIARYDAAKKARAKAPKNAA